MTKKHSTPMPSLVAEAVLSTCKIFLVFMILNNLFWGIIHFKPTAPRMGDNRIEITQTGNHDIRQNINN